MHSHPAEQCPARLAPQRYLSSHRICCQLSAVGDLVSFSSGVSRSRHLLLCLCCSDIPRSLSDFPHPDLRLRHWCFPSPLLFRGYTHFKISPKFRTFPSTKLSFVFFFLNICQIKALVLTYYKPSSVRWYWNECRYQLESRLFTSLRLLRTLRNL